MLFLNSSAMKVSAEMNEYLRERKITILNAFDNIVGKLLVMSQSSIFYSIFRSYLLQMRQNMYLCGKGFNYCRLWKAPSSFPKHEVKTENFSNQQFY